MSGASDDMRQVIDFLPGGFRDALADQAAEQRHFAAEAEGGRLGTS